jgi:predicted NBD/HSP70 family sugar kinase
MKKLYVPSHLKSNNRQVVYDLFSSKSEISRAEISRMTNISSPTILKIIDFFIEKEMAIEAGAGASPLGRKPKMQQFNANAFYSIGMDILFDTVKVGIVDLNGNTINSHSLQMRGSLEEMLKGKFVDYIDMVLKETGVAREKILGVAISIPGITDYKNYIIEYANIVGVVEKKDMKDAFDEFANKIGMKVYIENDINAAAIGEFELRKLDKNSDMIYFSIGTGIGSGIILNGKLRHGNRFFAGEIAYTSFDSNYSLKNGIGWMEKQFDFPALLQELQTNKAHSNKYNDSIEELASYVALCISNLAVALDIDLVVIGGMTVFLLGSPFMQKVRAYLSKISVIDIKCETQISQLSGLAGLATIVKNNTLNEILSE